MAQRDGGDDGWIDPRVVRERQRQLRRAKTQLVLMIDEIGPHAAVVLFNDGLRLALDRFREEAGPPQC